MSKLVSLLKATMSGGLDIFRYRGKTEKSRRMMPFLLATLIGVMMLFSSSVLVTVLKEDGAETTILALYTIVTSIIIVTEGVYKSGDLLFKPRDNDMLLAMPIKKSTIVAMRIIKLYVFELLYCLIFLLPAMIAYALNCTVDPSYYLVAFTVLLLVPVIPIAVSCVIGLISSAISARFKKRTLLQVIVSFFFLFVFAVIILAVNTMPDSGGKAMMAVSNKLAEYYYPATAFMRLATNFDIWEFLLFIGVNLVVAVVAVLFISRFYYRIITRLSTIRQNNSANVNFAFTKHSQTSVMVRKEFSRYFNTPVLLMNTAIGLMIFAVAVGALCIKYDDFVASLTSSVENFPLTADEIHSYLPSVTYVMVAFASLMTFITTTMISLEGKAFNLLKSMPISGKKVIMTKVLSAMLLIVPVTLLGSLVMCLRFQFGILDMILVLIGVIALPLVTELIGILIDLKYARFNAESDMVVVKQSAGVMVSTFLGLGMLLFTVSLTFGTVFLAGQTAGLAIMDAIYVIVALFLYFVVAMRGDEKFMKLTA